MTDAVLNMMNFPGEAIVAVTIGGIRIQRVSAENGPPVTPSFDHFPSREKRVMR